MADFLRAIFENQVVAFIIVVGVVVFVHELGHFLVARAFGIFVEEFSLGFGPRAFGFRARGTEYKVCWLPLGGYVRLYGSEIGANIPLERRGEALSTAALYKRVLVSAAGPLMNFVLTYVVMVVLSASGIEKLPTQISVVPGSVAEKSGLPDGATISSINGVGVRTWDELSEKISTNKGTPLNLGFTLAGVSGNVSVTPLVSDDETVYGEKVQVGRIGVTPYFLSPTVAVRKGGVFYDIGVRTGDSVVRIGGAPVSHFHQILPLLQKLPPQPPEMSALQSAVEIERAGATLAFPWTPQNADSLQRGELADSLGGALGVVSTDLVFGASKKPAPQGSALPQWQACGVSAGVALGEIDGYGRVRSRVQIADWLERSERQLAQQLAAGQMPSRFEAGFRVLNSEGETTHLHCAVAPRVGRDHLNRQKLFLDFPAEFATRSHTAAPILVKSDSFWGAIDDGFSLTWDMGKSIADSVLKLVTGRIPFSNLGGPVEIARVAGSAAKVGWQAFVGMIAFISINVGILNLLPIPVLDGGTLLLLGVEAAYGKTLPVKVQEYVMRAGVFFILILIVLVLYNDVLRRLAH